MLCHVQIGLRLLTEERLKADSIELHMSQPYPGHVHSHMNTSIKNYQLIQHYPDVAWIFTISNYQLLMLEFTCPRYDRDRRNSLLATCGKGLGSLLLSKA